MKVSLTLPLGLDNLLEQLTKFRKILICWLIIKDKKEQPKEVMSGKGGGAQMPSSGPPPSWHLHVLTNLEVLLILSLWVL